MKAPAQSNPTSPLPAQANTLVGFDLSSTPAWNPAAKRAMDITISVLVLVLASPLFLAVAIWMLVLSPGPILFKQERVGRNGRRFLCFKFRTMRVGASTAGHQAHLKDLIKSNTPMTKLDAKGDTRLIPGAWLLRASGLDELAQIINVLRGDMSLVGPRPCLPYEFEHYQPWQRARCEALPGLTGLWQVSGKNKTTFDQMIRLDIRYARTNTIWMDISIMFRTLPALVTQIIETRRARNAAPAPAKTSTAAAA
jgi:lipopolysaccharide/colanic/teichoic acid biosynthesis glycosyltransferase